MVQYSVLMSVYDKEKPEYLRESILSILNQTVRTDNFVLVCDGPLGQPLQNVIEEMKIRFGESMQVVRLAKNSGLGNALNYGLKFCIHDFIGRMDSDDISFLDRFERQIAIMEAHPEYDVISGTVLEFRDSTDQIVGKRVVPEQDDGIRRYSRVRSPFNHPAVFFRKESVKCAGGYRQTYPFFEDYDLWVRMLQRGNKGYNIPEPVLYMRTNAGMYQRRGGWSYAKTMIEFRKELLRSGWSSPIDYARSTYPHVIACLLPTCIRKLLYICLHGTRIREA